MDNPDAVARVAAFPDLCRQIIEIDRRNAGRYPQIKAIGRDCYRWYNYVIKSSPGLWNVKTRHEAEILRYVNAHGGTHYFTEFVAEATVENRVFLLLKHLPFPSLYRAYYRHRWHAFKILPGAAAFFEQEAEAILKLLREMRLVHRDIRPDNLLFDYHRRRLVLIDFGFAIRDGEEISTDDQQTHKMLENAIANNLGGEYRQPGRAFDFDTDAYSFDKIVGELKRLSPWMRFRSKT